MKIRKRFKKNMNKKILNDINKFIQNNKNIKSIYIDNIFKIIIKFRIKRNQNILPILLIMFNLIILTVSQNNEIKTKVRGGGRQPILFKNFINTPYQVLVNGYTTNIESDNYISNLEEGDNTIIMKWNYPIESASEMFSDLINLIEIDLSEFDASELTSMNLMFYGCTNLISINITNFNAPKLTNMASTFWKCESLISVDFSRSNIPSIDTISSLFHSCKSLKSINFQNFPTSKVRSFAFLFYSCSSLESIDLSNFDTTSVTRMNYMFSGCVSLTSLDLSNFRTPLLDYNPLMFSGCTNLKYLDISNFDTTLVGQLTSFLANCKSLEYIKLNNFIEGENIVIDNMLDGVPDDISYCINNINNMPKIMVELNNKNCSINDCSNDWNTKIKLSIDDKRICVYDCSEDEDYIYKFKNKCYNICPSNTVSSFELKRCLIVCPNELPFEKDEECINDCSAEDFFNEICIINNKNTDAKEKMVENIENTIIDESSNSFLDILNTDENDLTIKDINELYQITTSNNQKNKIYNNGETTIDLGECENKLKQENGLNEDETLIIYKMDYILDDLKIPITEYEIYNPRTKLKLDLNICSDTTININIPVDIDESILYKYNPYSDYYKNKCYPNPSECGNEDTLIERKDEFNDNFLSLCENNCKYIEYDVDTKKVKCECQIKNSFTKLSDIIANKNNLLYHITELDLDTESNTEDTEVSSNTESNTEDTDESSNTESNTKDTDSDVSSNVEYNTECLFKKKENKECESYVELQDLIEDRYIPLNSQKSIDKVFELFSKQLKDITYTNDEIIEGENVIFHMTTTEKQDYYLKNQLFNNISSIDLGECENILQKKFEIEEPLIIVKVDIKRNDTNSTQVEYQVFNPITLKPLDLSLCNNAQIDIYPPINIDEDIINLAKYLKKQGYDLFNSYDSFYNDVCSPFNSYNDTDVILNDRRNDFYVHNITLCEENCNYQSFDLETLKAKCECNVKPEVLSDSKKVKFSPNKIFENFYKVEKYANIKVVICYRQVFNKERLKKNYGSYIIMGIGVLFITLMISNFLTINKKAKFIINKLINQSQSMIKQLNLKEMEKNKEKSNKQKNTKTEVNKKLNKDNLSLNKRKNNSSISKLKLNDKENNNKKPNKNKINNPKKKHQIQKNKFNKNEYDFSINKKNKYSKKIEKYVIINNYNSVNSVNEKFLKKTNIKNIISKKKFNSNQLTELKEERKDINIIDKIILYIPKKERIKFFNDDELNSLEYKLALKIDFRTYLQFYYSLLKQTHLILFTFVVKNDYNLFLLKLCLFLISFSLFFFMNALFFNDDSMHKIYEDEGKYDFLYQIPQMLYSTIVSQVLGSLLEKLTLSQDEILNIKEKGEIKEMKKEIKNVIKCIKIKCFLFFMIGLILLLGFWYYLAAFCSVYYNTQKPLIKDNFISFGHSMLYPFALDLFPGIFRILGLKYKCKCLYIISNFVTKIIGIL